MSYSVALPRIKTKTRRKRRKPMPPWLKYWLALTILNGCFLARDVFWIARGDHDAGSMISLGLQAFWFTVCWGFMREHWKEWRKDDDE